MIRRARSRRNVRVVPVHPVAQADRLLGLDGGEAQDPLLALTDKALNPVVLNVPFGAEAQLLLHLHLHPEPLAVKAVLVAGLVALHGPEAVEEVLVGAPPAVVDTHRVVGGDRAVNERPAGAVLAEFHQFLEGLSALPEIQNLVLLLDEVYFGRDGLEHGHLLKTV